MMTADLRTKIDNKWEACWPTNELKPLVLLDLLSYLLFIKKIEEKQLVADRRAAPFKDIILSPREIDELSWSRFKNMDAQNMHKLFIKEKGLYDFIKVYGNTELQYSLYVKEPLSLIPTENLLARMVDIIKIMELEDAETRAAIFVYLLHKTEITGQNGQVYAPENIIKLMVALMQPAPEEVIWDPSAGNGSFLVNSAIYAADKNFATWKRKKHLNTARYNGIETDLIQLRIGAMNMILHGAEDFKLEVADVAGKIIMSLDEHPILILTNLFFKGVEDKVIPEATIADKHTGIKEINYLHFILKSLKTGGRAAIIIPDYILYYTKAEIKTIRQQVIDNYKLEAIINLPEKTSSLFSGASILIIAEPQAGITDRVWFYKMNPVMPAMNNDADVINIDKNEVPGLMQQYDEVPDILTQWKNNKGETGIRTKQSMHVAVADIKANNYLLSFNEYKKEITVQEEGYSTPKAAIAKKHATFKNPKAQAGSYSKNKRIPDKVFRLDKKAATILLSLFVACITVLAFYFFYYKDKNDKAAYTTTNYNDSPGITKAKYTSPKKRRDTLGSASKPVKLIKKIANNPENTRPQKKPGNISGANDTASQPLEIADSGTTDRASEKEQYTVKTIAYFHNQPDENTRRSAFINHWNNAVLQPIDDKNGFIYIVYKNTKGQTSKGWLNKKDLRPLQ